MQKINCKESKVEKVGKEIIASPLNGKNPFIVNEDDTVSMNFLLFTPTIFKYLEEKFPIFLENNKDNLLTPEFLIPDVLQDLVSDGIASTKVIRTSASWYGVTYKEDVEGVKTAIKDLVKSGEYNYNLWD